MKKVLIVGADACVNAALRRHGFDVKCVESVEEAVEILGAFDHLLIEDSNSLVLLDHVRKTFPDLPVIFVTAERDASLVLGVVRRGASDVLLRPFTDQALLEAIARTVQLREVSEKQRDYKENLERMVVQRTEMLRHAVEGIEPLYDLVLETLGDALDLKDAETEGHSRRVTAYTIVLARAMGISPEELKVIARGAYLHDIGKLAIPDGILRKPGRLSPEQMAIMREHCERGYRVLSKAPFLSQAAEIAFSHQEFFDGTGYPRGLKGDEIPLGARIFSVADAVDAMTSDRPYRQAVSFEAAQQEILRCSGTQFDPAVVEVFLKIPCDLWRSLHDDVNNQISTYGSGLAARVLETHASSPDVDATA